MDFTNGRMNYSTNLANQTSTNFALSVTTSSPAQLTAMNVRYLVLTDGYAADNVQLIASYTTISGGFNVSSSNPVSKSIPIISFDTTGGVSSFVSIAGMDVSSNINNLLDLGVILTLPNSVTLQFTVSSTSSTPTLLTSLSLTYIVFNTGYFNRANFAAF